MNTVNTITLPPLDGFTRAELCELVRVLHGGLVRAQADYDALAVTTKNAIGVLEAVEKATRA